MKGKHAARTITGASPEKANTSTANAAAATKFYLFVEVHRFRKRREGRTRRQPSSCAAKELEQLFHRQLISLQPIR